MATQNLTLTITTPGGVTIVEALRLFTEHHNYNANKIGNETRLDFTRRTLSRLIREAIIAQKDGELKAAVQPDLGITVE